MLSTLALTVAHGPFGGPGLGLWIIHPILTLVWIGLLITLIVVIARRRRGAMAGGWGGPPWAAHHAARSAESTLAERFANGDIDEKEYRARLEVLRTNGSVPPSA